MDVYGSMRRMPMLTVVPVTLIACGTVAITSSLSYRSASSCWLYLHS
jgi:hypothetical protein